MSGSLLDVNVLIALFDSDHVHHERAHAWLDQRQDEIWTTCAITENGFVRIVSQPRYPSPVPASVAVRLLADTAAATRHAFWTCELSLLDDAIDPSRLLGARQITDAYLLALAVAHDGRLVTFDRGVPLSAVRGAGPEHLQVL